MEITKSRKNSAVYAAYQVFYSLSNNYIFKKNLVFQI